MANKDSVVLRQRRMPSGNTSLYLDIYRHGRRQYEYLKLYLVPEATPADRRQNKDTLRLAEAVRAKRLVEVQNDEFEFKTTRRNVLVVDYAEGVAAAHGGKAWRQLIKHLRQYDGDKHTTFKAVTTEWLDGFYSKLDNAMGERGAVPLSQNTKWLYQSKLICVLNQAVKDDLIKGRIVTDMKRFKQEEVEREFLTLDELRLLVDDAKEVWKRAFLFSCLTGLRWSDVTALRWSDVTEGETTARVTFRQKKTRGQEYMDITRQALALMGDRGADSEIVFSGCGYLCTTNLRIKRWVARAGITKHISFHCARHTFAIMMLDLGTDIYTVSKLLGHRELSTTQVYAKVLDKNKQKAVMAIPDIVKPKQ